MKRFVRVGKMTQVFKIQVLVAGDKFITLNMEGVYQKVQKVMRHTTVVDEKESIFNYVAKKDLLLYNPYHSFEHFIHFLYEAVQLPPTSQKPLCATFIIY